MKPQYLLALLPLLAGTATAATTAAFDGGADTPSTLQTFGDPGAATYEAAGGNPGGFLQLSSNINGQNNYATFNRSDAGTFAASTFSFQFRIDNLGAGGADGFNFSYLPTSTYGVSGALVGSPFGAAEDPAAAGVLGFGFDTWGNGAPNDNAPGGVEFGSNYSEISVFYNGGLVSRIDDTRLIGTPFNIKDGAWHQVTGTVNFGSASVSLSVDGNTIWNNLAVPGLSAYESRITMGARTGGANARQGIDNLNVAFVPEASSSLLATLAGLGMLSLRRRK